MGVIQGAINSMLGSASHAVMAVRGYQAIQEKKIAAEEKKKDTEKKKTTPSPVQTTASPQQMAADKARQSADNAIAAKKQQRKRRFADYLAKQPSSVGTVGNLPQDLQAQIARQYTPSQRRRLMDRMDKEGAQGGKHKQSDS